MPVLHIPSESPEAWLEFSGDSADSYCRITLADHGLTASLDAYMPVGDWESLVGFFVDLAQHWRGWKGEKTWGSVESDFAIRVAHDGIGHAFADVQLQRVDNPRWKVETRLALEPGHLEELAKQASLLFSRLR